MIKPYNPLSPIREYYYPTQAFYVYAIITADPFHKQWSFQTWAK